MDLDTDVTRDSGPRLYISRRYTVSNRLEVIHGCLTVTLLQPDTLDLWESRIVEVVSLSLGTPSGLYGLSRKGQNLIKGKRKYRLRGPVGVEFYNYVT